MERSLCIIGRSDQCDRIGYGLMSILRIWWQVRKMEEVKVYVKQIGRISGICQGKSGRWLGIPLTLL